MKKSSLGLSFRHALALCAFALGGSLSAACMVPPDESKPADEQVDEAQQMLPECCEKVGMWSCPGGDDYEYFPLLYCGPLRTQVGIICNNNCDDPCTDSGWYNDCVP